MINKSKPERRGQQCIEVTIMLVLLISGLALILIILLRIAKELSDFIDDMKGKD